VTTKEAMQSAPDIQSTFLDVLLSATNVPSESRTDPYYATPNSVLCIVVYKTAEK
jgi:hypothetical protein